MYKSSDPVEAYAPNHARYPSAVEQSALTSKGSHDPMSTSYHSKLGRRQRARQACLTCRARKIRCDVCFSGVPCLNCKLDSQECVVKPRIRKWATIQSSESQKSAEAGDCEGPHDVSPAIMSPSHYLPDLIEDFVTSGDQSGATVDIDTTPTSTSLHKHSAKTCFSTSSATIEATFRENEPDSAPEDSADAICDLRHELSKLEENRTKPKATSSQSSAGFLLASFYHFVKLPTFTKMDPDAAQFLEKRGCLHLPAPPILEEIIQSYFLYFHPLVPLLVEQAFWEAYDGHGSADPLARAIPLFILQAMLFVSCPYVSLESLDRLGFRTVKEARAEFYSRAKTLFDLQIDLDDRARSQGALMLTYRTTEFNDRSATYWLGISIHYAKNIEAYCYDENLDLSLKRLWWCCVLRDRVLALALRQAPLISPEAVDFSHGGFVFGDFAHEVRSSRVYGAPVKKVLVQVAIVLCDLGMILNDVPLEHHSTTGRMKNKLRPDQIKALLSKLDNWYQNTYVELRTASLSAGAHDSIILFSNVLYTYYYAAKALLYNYILLGTVSSNDAISPNHDRTRLEAQGNLSRCVRGIAENLMELKNFGLVKYLPITFISFAATPLVWDLLQAQMLNFDDRAQGLKKDLKTHLDVMGGFNDLYENAESTVRCVKHIVEHVKTQEPLPQPKVFAQGSPQTGLDSQTQPRGGRVTSWKDFVVEDPQRYLRIVLTVEYSLAHGHCPSEADFPQSLRMPQHGITTHSWEELGSSVDPDWFNEAFDDIITSYSDPNA
ncbi:unnamed protein product [Clonostachys byssicola]|uniref:Zn(2)-C6 fungal-type domain-containing protein n=1 Tax=Clonostachys byssicola TaxID=160290 RepID=A0A9N9UBS8_9HYPO|nr:unnamed protein product [Clonostachys byssicola]